MKRLRSIPILVEIEPVSILEFKSRANSKVALYNVSGIDPVSWFSSRSRNIRCDKSPRVVGIGPTREFLSSPSSTSWLNAEISLGIVPLKLLSSILILTTSPCSLQVIPPHWHSETPLKKSTLSDH